MENNNKEAFQLLSVNGSESSLSDPEIAEYVVAPKKKLSKRRSRTLPSSNRVTQPKPPCVCTSRTASVAVAAALLVCWLCTLSWLAFVLHSELARLDGNVQRACKTASDTGGLGQRLEEAPLPGWYERPAMEAVDHVGLASRPGSGGGLGGGGVGAKKMKKRKELDALVAVSRVSSGAAPTTPGAKLLSETSDEEDSSCGGAGAAKKRRSAVAASRRLRVRRRTCAIVLRVCTALLALACVVAAAAVMWLFADVREQVAVLRMEVDQVVAGSENVPDDLQRMHSVNRELQRNQTILSATLATLTAHIANLSAVVSKVQDDLGEVRQRLNNAPELVSLPQEVKDLSKNVANWGSRIQDLTSTVDTLKQQESTLAQNITSLEQRMSELARQPVTPAPVAPVDGALLKELKDAADQVAANLTNVNLTLSTKLNWLQDEFNKDHSKLVKIEDGAQNASARIKTLEVQCTRVEVVDSLNQTVRSLGERLDTTGQQVQDVKTSLADLRRVSTMPPLPLQSSSTVREAPISPLEGTDSFLPKVPTKGT